HSRVTQRRGHTRDQSKRFARDLPIFPLEPLNEAAARVLLEQEAGSALPTLVTRWIYQRAEGNPLFTLEFLRDLRRRGTLTWRGSDWHWEAPRQEHLPNTIEAMIEYVLEGIQQPELREVLESRALLGREEPEELWLAATEFTGTQLTRAKRDLEQFGVFRDDDFMHPLFREVVLKNTSSEQRRRLSKRLFEHLKTRDLVRAVRFVNDAGIDSPVAFQALQRAIELETDITRTAHLKSQLLDHCPLESRFDLALEVTTALLDCDVPAATRAADLALQLKPGDLEAINRRARLFGMSGQPQHGMELLESVPIEERSSRWWLHYCDYWLLTRNRSAAWGVYQHHPEIHDLLDVRMKTALVHHMFDEGWSDQAEQILSELFNKPDLSILDRVRVLNAKGTRASENNQRESANAFFQEALELCQRNRGIVPLTAMRTLRLNHALSCSVLGQYRAAQQALEALIEEILASGQRSLATAAQVSMAVNLKDMGLYARAEHTLLQAKLALTFTKKTNSACECEKLLAVVYWYWRPPNGAVLCLKHVRTYLAMTRKLAVTWLIQALFWNVLIELEFGQLERTFALDEELKVLTETKECAPKRWLWHWAHGLSLEHQGRIEEARYHLRQALNDRDDPFGDDYQHIQLELCRLDRDVSGARGLLEVFRGREYSPGVTSCLRYFPELEEVSAEFNDDAVALRIHVLGSMQVVHAGVVTPIRGAKRKHLIALLLEAQISGQDECKHSDLADALYPNGTDEVTRTAIRQLVFQWRARFGAESIITTANGYALQHVDSDAREFLETGQTHLWRGTYLRDVEDWASGGLETVRNALYTKLKQIANELVPDASAEAVRLAKIALDAEPFDTDALMVTLRALRAQGSYNSISRMYARTRETWLEVGERLPESWSEFLSAARAA
ncbi:MAG: hypothetical protein HC933_23300, partial [Pleurocapsa sp. SU_196_0]|nr:hypothetical protein [Pleurocapsa sp. SU_196_0]